MPQVAAVHVIVSIGSLYRTGSPDRNVTLNELMLGKQVQRGTHGTRQWSGVSSANPPVAFRRLSGARQPA